MTTKQGKRKVHPVHEEPEAISVSQNHCCESGSGLGRIRIILPNPDRYQCQAYENVKILYFFHKISIC
jgi:hypothetical protein